MGLQRASRSLYVASVTIVVACAGSALWIVAGPSTQQVGPAALPDASPVSVPPVQRGAAIPSIEDLRAVASCNLRPRPASAGPPAPEQPSQPASPPPPPLSLRVGGIVIEAGRRSAVLVSDAGAISVCGVGETTNGVRVVEVAEGHVVLDNHGRQVTLMLPKSATGGS